MTTRAVFHDQKENLLNVHTQKTGGAQQSSLSKPLGAQQLDVSTSKQPQIKATPSRKRRALGDISNKQFDFHESDGKRNLTKRLRRQSVVVDLHEQNGVEQSSQSRHETFERPVSVSISSAIEDPFEVEFAYGGLAEPSDSVELASDQHDESATSSLLGEFDPSLYSTGSWKSEFHLPQQDASQSSSNDGENDSFDLEVTMPHSPPPPDSFSDASSSSSFLEELLNGEIETSVSPSEASFSDDEDQGVFESQH